MVDAEIRHGLSDQIRAMRERRGWSQTDLAKRMGTSQPAVARIETSRDKYLSFPTLLSVANAFDVAVLVRFVPFSELVRRSLDASEYEQAPLSFEEELTLVSEQRLSAPPIKRACFTTPPATAGSLTTRLNDPAVVIDELYQPVA
ncbi:MAG: helix-turn-helix domain-containing protein [Thermoanaerobaculia bacterium]